MKIEARIHNVSMRKVRPPKDGRKDYDWFEINTGRATLQESLDFLQLVKLVGGLRGTN